MREPEALAEALFVSLPVIVGKGNGPAILSKFMASSFNISVLDSAKLGLF